ncbi:MAG: EscU/YscU/HrcU family type III secretion system export apparatus switch protein [Myxococcales bacterium]|nr:EscU/YscU/HrcU family type III secretion system export apparatus switch protein [Myxococcales bacterium]MCB9579325.1 EscU/YscU/HrcU family type III secretion system export apparatus switch protein [Polyangiaceae bacterium]
MSEHDDSEKTLEATPERRKKAREDGQFPRSRDAAAVAASLAVLAGLMVFQKQLGAELRELASACFSQTDQLRSAGVTRIAGQAMTSLALIALPIALVAAAAAVAMGFAEAGYMPRLELVEPKWNRLAPLGKLKQLFSPQTGASNTALALGRVAVVGGVAYKVCRDAFPALTRLSRTPLSGGIEALLDIASRLALWSTLALAVLSAIDYATSWFRHEKQIRMSHQEMKDEFKQQEGDPRVKSRQRAKAREMLRRNIAKEVKTADVVVTNPTHVAVALRYRPEEGAPVVVAKGYDEVAQYIKKLAKEYGIVAVENVPLARTLAERVKTGKTIPMELYAAVAEVLAFVFRMRNRGVRA